MKRNLSCSLCLALIYIIYIYLAYNYLSNLKSCSCAEGDYVENVKNAEGIIMVLLLSWIAISFLRLKRKNKILLLGGLSILLFLTYIYFCFYVYKMQRQLTTNCICAMKWQRWLIYIQYGFFLFEILLVFIGVFLQI